MCPMVFELRWKKGIVYTVKTLEVSLNLERNVSQKRRLIQTRIAIPLVFSDFLNFISI